MAPLEVWAHDACLLHDAPGHFERPARFDAALAGATAAAATRLDAPRATEDLLARVHTRAHIERVRRACEAGAAIDADTYATPTSFEAALRAAGGAVQAALSAAEGRPAFSIGRPPGHHATREHAMGFCLFNNVAVAAEALAKLGHRVAIVDIDVHHGNGTQDIFAARNDVHYTSLHEWPQYPGTGRVDERGDGEGEGATLNLPLPAGTAHEGWLEVFDGAVLPALARHAPDVILVSAGFDADHRDPLGGLILEPATFHAAVARLRNITPRIAAILEGGYELAALTEGTRATAAALVGAADPSPAPRLTGARPWAALAPQLVDKK